MIAPPARITAPGDRTRAAPASPLPRVGSSARPATAEAAHGAPRLLPFRHGDRRCGVAWTESDRGRAVARDTRDGTLRRMNGRRRGAQPAPPLLCRGLTRSRRCCRRTGDLRTPLSSARAGKVIARIRVAAQSRRVGADVWGGPPRRRADGGARLWPAWAKYLCPVVPGHRVLAREAFRRFLGRRRGGSKLKMLRDRGGAVWRGAGALRR